MEPKSDLTERLERITLLLMDCDGVLTDGRLYFSAGGEELKVFDVKDGQGLVMWHQAGFRSGIISGRNSSIVDVRARQLGIEFVHQGSSEKLAAFEKIITDVGVSPDEVAFIGDDLPDAHLMPRVGLAVAVADAHISAKSAAHLVTANPGGRGAVRELIDLILKAKKSNN